VKCNFRYSMMTDCYNMSFSVGAELAMLLVCMYVYVWLEA